MHFSRKKKFIHIILCLGHFVTKCVRVSHHVVDVVAFACMLQMMHTLHQISLRTGETISMRNVELREEEDDEQKNIVRTFTLWIIYVFSLFLALYFVVHVRQSSLVSTNWWHEMFYIFTIITIKQLLWYVMLRSRCRTIIDSKEFEWRLLLRVCITPAHLKNNFKNVSVLINSKAQIWSSHMGTFFSLSFSIKMISQLRANATARTQTRSSTQSHTLFFFSFVCFH